MALSQARSSHRHLRSKELGQSTESYPQHGNAWPPPTTSRISTRCRVWRWGTGSGCYRNPSPLDVECKDLRGLLEWRSEGYSHQSQFKKGWRIIRHHVFPCPSCSSEQSMQTLPSGQVPLPNEGNQTGFLEESPGNHSSMRLMCMLSMITAIILSGLVVAQSLQQSGSQTSAGNFNPPRNPEILYIIYGFLISAFAPKAVQKFAEQKIPAYRPPLPSTFYAGYLPAATATPPPVQPAVTPPAATAAVYPPDSAPPPANALQTVVQRGAL